MITNKQQEFTFEELHALDFSFDQPFRLRLKDNEIIECEKILRIMPHKRIVAAGVWQDQDIVAKIFFDPRHCYRHVEWEMAGIQSLQRNKVPTPDILLRSVTADDRIQVILFERILESKNLQAIWEERHVRETDFSPLAIDGMLSLLKAVIMEIATQHVLGLVQQDTSFKNFLVTDKVIYTLDGAQLHQYPFLYPRKPSMKNLASFLSRLGAGVEKLQENLFLHYAKARGWAIKEEDKLEMFFLIKQWDQARWKEVSEKIGRNSTQFARMKCRHAFVMVDRHFIGPELQHFLFHPEEVFNQMEGQLLKDGNSTTVKKIQLDQRIYVIKRYNFTSFFHFLRRCLRPTRAYMCWRFAHKLGMFQVPTAKPVAFVEKRFLGFRGKSFFVTEYVSHENVAQYFARYHDKPLKITEMIKRTTALIKSLLSIEITHGDLKITNILINKNEQPVLIDLDGTTEHVSLSGLRKGFQKEWKRFLRNFEGDTALQEKFKEEFRKNYGLM